MEEENDYNAYTVGNVIDNENVTMHFTENWPEDSREETAIHEMLHALGLHHEHQRHDRSKHGVIVLKNKDSQYKKKEGTSITKFDAFSIMNYYGNEYMYLNPKEFKSNVYYLSSPLRKGNAQATYMSDLDEIALNLIHCPVQRLVEDDNFCYNPKKSKKNIKCPLYYCLREKVVNRQFKCEDYGPNCAACRVLKNDSIPTKNDENRLIWQGSSGLFYCGKYLGDEKYCGPDQGPNCSSCESLLKP